MATQLFLIKVSMFKYCAQYNLRLDKHAVEEQLNQLEYFFWI